MAKFQNKVAITIEAPVESTADSKQVKAGIKALVEAVINYGKILEVDGNAIIQDVILISRPEDYSNDLAKRPVNVHIADLMKKTQMTKDLAREITKPKTVEVDEVETERTVDEDPPRVHVHVATPPAATSDVYEEANLIIETIFSKLKRTSKSVAIVTVFAKNAGKELTVDDIAAASKIPKQDLGSWLGVTGKTIKAISSTGRGKYKLDPDKVSKAVSDKIAKATTTG